MDKNSSKMSQNNLKVLTQQSKQPSLLKSQLKTSKIKTYNETAFNNNDSESVDDYIKMLKAPAVEIQGSLTEEKGFDSYVEDTAKSSQRGDP